MGLVDLSKSMTDSFMGCTLVKKLLYFGFPFTYPGVLAVKDTAHFKIATNLSDWCEALFTIVNEVYDKDGGEISSKNIASLKAILNSMETPLLQFIADFQQLSSMFNSSNIDELKRYIDGLQEVNELLTRNSEILEAATLTNFSAPGWLEVVVAFYAAIHLISEPNFQNLWKVLDDLYEAYIVSGDNGGPVCDNADPIRVALEQILKPLKNFVNGAGASFATVGSDESVTDFLASVNANPQAFPLSSDVRRVIVF
jgi:hypothetical protein